MLPTSGIGSEIEPWVSVERAACNKTHHVWWLGKVVFGNPCGTPVFLQRIKFLANQVLGPRFLVKVVPRRGLEPPRP